MPRVSICGVVYLCLVVLLVATTACSTGPATSVQTSLRLVSDASFARVDDGASSLLSYRHAGAKFKPYVDRLFTPKGVQVLRDAPKDHAHHHGLMLAFGLNDDVDFWSEVHAKVAGRQLGGPVRMYTTTDGAGAAISVMEQSVEWVDGRDETVMLREARTVEVSEGRQNAPTRVTWRSRLAAGSSPATLRLWGRHYFGLGMRFVESMDKTGRFLTVQGEVHGQAKLGKVVRGDERLARSQWCAYVAECEGRMVTVAMFDHPGNPRHPATWFTMRKPFAYLSATLALQAEQLQIDTASPLQLCYGVALWDGSIATDVIEKAYQRWRSGH